MGISTNFSNGSSDLYFLVPKRFGTIVSGGESLYTNLHQPPIRNQNINITDIHIRYPESGRFHITARKDNEIVQERVFIEHEPLNELTHGKRILSIIPKSADHYPVYRNSDEEYVWKIESTPLPNFFNNKPIQLNFWIGTGQEIDIVHKINAIKQIEISENTNYVEAYGGQDNHIQLFMTVTCPQSLNDFPDTMRIWMHPKNSIRLRRNDASN